ncbi:MAG: deoxynucleoside kinase [Bacteroidales bacterium]
MELSDHRTTRPRDHATTRPPDHPTICYTLPVLDFRFITLEGPPGVGKSALAEKMAARLDATVVLEEPENPFLQDFHNGRPGSALQAQLYFLLSRHRQQTALRQADLFTQLTVCDYLFEKDKIYGYLNLDDNELFIYQRLYDLLAREIATPDLVVFLQAPVDLLVRRHKERRRQAESEIPALDPAYLRAVSEAYQHFFFHYSSSPLLVVDTAQLDLQTSDEALDDLIKQISTMGRGTQYYVPRT